MALCCVVCKGDTLDVATVSAQKETAVVSLCPVSSISSGMIEATGTIGLHEAIERFSGVSVKDYGGIGGLKTVSVRNMGAAHTTVIYDGMAISDAQNGQVDISRFNLDDVSSVSVTIGVDDDIFRSARHLTSAGILKIETAAPDSKSNNRVRNGETEESRLGSKSQPHNISARMTAGSFNTYNPHLSYSQKLTDSYSLRVSANGTFSSGDYPFLLHNIDITSNERRLNSDVRILGSEADFIADWKEKGTLRVKANLHGSERGLPGPVILYTQNEYERLWDRSLISGAMYDIQWNGKWKFHADLGYSYSYNRYTNTNPIYSTPQDDRYTQNEYTVAARGMYIHSQHWEFSLASDFFTNTLSSNTPECPFPVRYSWVSAASALYKNETLKINANLVKTYISEVSNLSQSSKDRFRLSPMIGLNWSFHRLMHLRASWKDGFRAPTFNDLYYARVGNTSLKPETGWQSNLGLTFRHEDKMGSVELSADAYLNRLKDKISAIPTMFIWKMQNVGEALMYGTDVNLHSRFTPLSKLSIILNANWSLQYATDVTDENSKTYRHQLAYTPRHCGSGDLTITTAWVNVSYRLNAAGKRYTKGQNIASNLLSPYADHSVSINRSFDFGTRHRYRIAVSLEGLNLSGNNYEIIHNYPMPGRSYRISVKFKY